MPDPHRWVNLTRKYDPARLTISCMVQFKAPYDMGLLSYCDPPDGVKSVT